MSPLFRENKKINKVDRNKKELSRTKGVLQYFKTRIFQIAQQAKRREEDGGRRSYRQTLHHPEDVPFRADS